MSTAGWALIALLFIIPVYGTSKTEVKATRAAGRQRRSIWNLQDMVTSVTGREGGSFINYGHWCGVGGSGVPVDPIDECCQNHDICYNVTKKGVCRDRGDKAIYHTEYKWHVADDETAVCEDEDDHCKMSICLCDAVLANCLKSNIDFYNHDKFRPLKPMEIVQAAYDIGY